MEKSVVLTWVINFMSLGAMGRFVVFCLQCWLSVSKSARGSRHAWHEMAFFCFALIFS